MLMIRTSHLTITTQMILCLATPAIPRNMTGLATKLKEGGYATHQDGKWDAGMATPDHTSMGRGFDTSFGYFHHANDFYTETAKACNGTKIVDIWVTDKPTRSWFEWDRS